MRLSPRAQHVDAAGALYFAGVRGAGKGSLDKVVARFLKDHPQLGDDGRAFVVDVVQDMWRNRARLEASAKRLSFDPTRGALVSLFLAGARGVEARELPVDPRGVPELVKAWRALDDAPLAVRASIPAWLVDELARGQHDSDALDSLEALCLSFTDAPPTTLRANALKGTRDDVIRALAVDGIDAVPTTLSPHGLTLTERANVFRTAAFHEGLFEMQDEGSQLVSFLCEARAGHTVIDACAGAGGKTLHLAALMEGKGTLHAFDTAQHRLDALRERARRAGAHNVRAHDVEELSKIHKRLRGTADVVLVDAPCTGTGVLRRNPDTSWQLSRDDVDRLVKTQRAILDDAALLVAPGGRLVYATCSLLDDENTDVVDAFLAAHDGFARVSAKDITQRQGLNVALDDDLALDPLHHGTDGFYGAALVRLR